ncbi:MAG: FGGY-family carbohydrate kinase [Rhodobacteraceae bacterium]|nr:FGGY-family carbohydrate kinase [Paracoccaceae bacterium]
MSLALGIDIGTSGVRSAVIDPDGRIIAMARASHLAQDPANIDATLWWTAVETCLTRQIEALREAGQNPADIAGLAVDGTSGSMVLTDANLRPVTRALMYNSKGFDTEAARIAKVAPKTHITQGSNSALARAMHLTSETRGPAHHLLHQADYITAKLLGYGGYSDHNNALKTGFDPETEQWPDWTSAVFDPHLLPKVMPVGANLGTMCGAVSQKFGFDNSVRVHAGTTDSIAAFLACAPMERGTAVTSLGSTLAIKILSETRIDDPRIGLYSHRLGNMWLVGGASNTGGAVLAHFFSPDEIAHLSAEIDPHTPSGLDYYPLLEPGERFPVNDPALAPRLSPRPESDAQFLHGIFEGIAQIEALSYREIEARGGPKPHQLFGAGGGSTNKTFAAIRHRALGLEPKSSEHSEAAIGATKLVLWVEG